MLKNKENLFLCSIGIYLTYKLIDDALNKGYSISMSHKDISLSLTPPNTYQSKGYILNPFDDI